MLTATQAWDMVLTYEDRAQNIAITSGQSFAQRCLHRSVASIGHQIMAIITSDYDSIDAEILQELHDQLGRVLGTIDSITDPTAIALIAEYDAMHCPSAKIVADINYWAASQ